MCFYIDIMIQNKEKIATRDLKAYKKLILLKGDLKSPYRGRTYWVKGELKRARGWKSNAEFYIDNGFHAYRTLAIARRNVGGDIFECIVPKGSKYFKNAEQIVSNQMTLKSKRPVPKVKKNGKRK